MERLPEFIANHLFLCTLFVSILMLLIWNFVGDSVTGMKPLTPAEATNLINRENAIILDLRSESDFGQGHIINAMNIPAKQLSDSSSKLEKHKDVPIVVYCQNGSESSRMIRELKQKGFEKLHFLRGGLEAWQNSNFPVTKTKS